MNAIVDKLGKKQLTKADATLLLQCIQAMIRSAGFSYPSPNPEVSNRFEQWLDQFLSSMSSTDSTLKIENLTLDTTTILTTLNILCAIDTLDPRISDVLRREIKPLRPLFFRQPKPTPAPSPPPPKPVVPGKNTPSKVRATFTSLLPLLPQKREKIERLIQLIDQLTDPQIRSLDTKSNASLAPIIFFVNHRDSQGKGRLNDTIRCLDAIELIIIHLK